MKIIAIIPARSGSKRIPRKNIRSFMGKPIIAYTIDAAQRTDIFDDIIVSTDDDEIAAVAEQYGANIPFIRPKEIADDVKGIKEVIAHAVKELEKQKKMPGAICVIYATAPLLCHQDIILAYKQWHTTDKDFIFTVTTFPATIFRAFGLESDLTTQMFWPENYPKNSQDFPTAYHDAGQFLWGRPEAFLEKKTIMFSERSLGFVIPRHRVIDIDTLEDWQHAETLYAGLLAMEDGAID